jgi:hypothetical protein
LQYLRDRWCLHKLDAQSAFHHDALEEGVYMK